MKEQIPADYNIWLLPYFYNTTDEEANADSVVKLALDEISESKAKDIWFTVYVKVFPFPNKFCSIRIILCKFTSVMLASSSLSLDNPKVLPKPKNKKGKDVEEEKQDEGPRLTANKLPVSKIKK